MTKRDWIRCAGIWQDTGDVFVPSMWMNAGLTVHHVNECIQAFDAGMGPEDNQSAFDTSAQLAQLCCEKGGLA